MSHLGDRVAALVDGELDHESRDRAFAHIATCDACRAEVDAVRRLKARIRALSEPELTPDLRLRLLSVARSSVSDERPLLRGDGRRFRRLPRRSAGPAVRGPHTALAVSLRPLTPGRQGPLVHRNRSRLVAASAVCVIALTLTTAFAVGGPAPSTSDPVTPAVDQYAVEHAVVVGDLPLSDAYAGSEVMSTVYPSLTDVTGPETMNLPLLDTRPAVLDGESASAVEPVASAGPSTGTPAGSASSPR